ncbi:hypothetical protein Nm8I071_23160 [Nonomuraea sp. TT08I-71]|nr:hypothetical protein Nm8I071_23160 [Nonomuraea sp. TT08I-71]
MSFADKGYSSKAIRANLRRRGIGHTIPERADQQANRRRRGSRGSRGGRPPTFDKQLYKRRNVVERCFNRLKQCRSVATRSDKTATSYQATVTIAALLNGCEPLKARPRGVGWRRLAVRHRYRSLAARDRCRAVDHCGHHFERQRGGRAAGSGDSVLVATLSPIERDLEIPRFVDAFVGGGVAL